MLPWAGAVYLVLEHTSFFKRQEHFAMVHVKSKVTSVPDTVPIFIAGNTQGVSNCPKSIRLARCNAKFYA